MFLKISKKKIIFITIFSNNRKKEMKELQNFQKKVNNIATVRPYLSKITLNVNGQHSSIKRHSIAKIKDKIKIRHSSVLPTRVSL